MITFMTFISICNLILVIYFTFALPYITYWRFGRFFIFNCKWITQNYRSIRFFKYY